MLFSECNARQAIKGENNNMVKISTYQTKKGTRYKFSLYTGVDPISGKSKTVTYGGFTTIKEAKSKLVHLQYQLNKNGNTDNNVKTYLSVYHEWDIAYINTVKPSTYLKTKQIFKKHILPIFGKHRINKITVTFCQQALNNYATYYGSYKKLWNYVKTIFEYAIQLQYISRNPAKYVKYPKDTHKHVEYKFYTPEELKEFLQCIDEEYKDKPKIKTFFRVLAYSGMRKGEMLALSWDNIDFNNNTISIKHSISVDINDKPVISTPKNKSSVRCISMDNETMHILKQWQITQRKELLQQGYKPHFVFNSVDNGILSASKPRKWCKHVTNKYHLKSLRIHDFRHTHASILINSGVNIKAVSQRLGHSNIQTTLDIYTHVAKQQSKKTAITFAKIINL